MEQTFDAFISYRHLPEDMAVAQKLQSLLESRKKEDGTRLTVFRDKSDLPTTSDLGADIEHALENSRYLIIIASPTYQESKWCMRELEYFRQTHGGNRNVLLVLVNGEPDESFPEVLRYREETVLDPYGAASVVRVEMEPLAADVRAQTHRERMKLLRVEYLRIAAPILGVSFDQLYHRAQRRKIALLTTAVAALAAFLVYSVFLIAQINQRQRMLEAKQQELYQNESIRLANEAMLLLEEDPALAMLLAHTALPEDLEDPDYPITQEVERSIRSAALQHQYDEATALLTHRASLTFQSTEWEFSAFLENGRYFAVCVPNWTHVYEARTGMLVGTIPSEDVIFFNGLERCLYTTQTIDEDGTRWTDIVVCDVRTGAELWRLEKAYLWYAWSYWEYDEETGQLWFEGTLPENDDSQDSGELDSRFGWFDQEGIYHEADAFPEFSDSASEDSSTGMWYFWSGDGAKYCTDLSHDYYPRIIYDVGTGTCTEEAAWADSLPEEYLQVALAALRELAADFEVESIKVDSITKCADELHYTLGCDLEGIGWRAFIWSTEAERLIWSDAYDIFQEADSKLFYRILDRGLQVFESNPENYDLPQAPPVFEYVSENGVYGFGSWDHAEHGFVFAYDTSKLKGVVSSDNWHRTIYEVTWPSGTIEEPGDYLYACPRFRFYDITPDGTGMVIVTRNDLVYLVDVIHGSVLFQTASESLEILAATIHQDGTLFAYAMALENSVEIVLWDGAAGKLIGRKRIDCTYSSPSVYLEIRDTSLLVNISGNDEALIYDLGDFDRDPRHVPGMHYGFSEGSLTSPLMTADGLLILSRGVMSPYTATYTVGEIWDMETGKSIDFYSFSSLYDQAYHYDPVGGNLILQYENDFYIQRRGESGDFEVVYTITPRYEDMLLDSAGHETDGTWLVLQNEEYCEIYRLEDGVLCYSLRKPDGRSSQFGVIDGKLYDFCMGWDRGCIPLPDTGEARAYSLDVLSHDGIRRTLTDGEMQAYYIPSHWQDK